MTKDELLDNDELEHIIKKMQDQMSPMWKEIYFFIKPFLVSTCNDMKEDRPGVPRIMIWISNEFYAERDNERKKFLKDLHDKLRKTIPMDLNSVKPLPEVVEEEVDLGIFER